MVVEYISDTTDVRELSRSVLASEFSDAEIIKEQKAAYSDIGVFTHKFDWDSDDQEFPSIQKIETELASIYVLKHYLNAQERQVLDADYQNIINRLQWIKDNMPTETTDEGDTIERTEYQSWNLNPTLPYTSKLSPSLSGEAVQNLSLESE